MYWKLGATLVTVVACLAFAGGAEAQDLGSTTAAMGAAATIGTGLGSSASALSTARGAGGTSSRGLQIEEADGPGRAPEGSAAGARRGGSGGSGITRERGFYIDDDEDDGPEFMGPAPEEYVVHKGDTLWDLCGRYMGDPWAWPKVWAMNPSVTNPHWIFPGDKLRFGGGGPKVAAGPSKGKGPRLTVARTGGPLSGGMILRTNGFVTMKEMAGSARIAGSREEKQLLTVHDQIYVDFPSDHPLKVGERYTIYKPKSEVKHPISGALVGHLVEIVGEVRIDQITQGGIARATVIEALDIIERGDRVGALLRRIRPVARRPNRVQLEGRILGMIRMGTLIGAKELIFLDRGRKQGVEAGNIFYVIRRGDGNRPMMERIGDDQDARFPKEVVAEIVIVESREDTSTGYVMRATKETKAGDRVEMRKGY